jgi:hypothetical protein
MALNQNLSVLSSLNSQYEIQTFQFCCKTSISNFELTLIHIPMFTMFAPEVEPMGEAGTSFISAQ